MASTVLSILRRVPIVIAPALGGIAIATYGLRGGVRVGLGVSLYRRQWSPGTAGVPRARSTTVGFATSGGLMVEWL